MRYVIIGNSAAAIGCIEGIRQRDTAGKITLVADEPHHTYSRPLISYLLGGKTDRARMRYRPDDFYEKNGVETLLGVQATEIDAPAKRVVLEDGRRVAYDRLLLATGSTPFQPEIDGLETVKSRHSFMTLDDAAGLENTIKETTRVLILGAGLIGLKCAEGLWAKTKHITVVDLAGQILPSILDAQAAAMMQKHIEAKGIRFLLGDSVQSLAQDKAVLKSGKQVEFDALVVAVGVRPNISLAASAGAETGRGIVTDRFCRTTVENIYAAGDCTLSHDISSGQQKVLALLPNAYLQGECAGLHMAGAAAIAGGQEEKAYDKALPMNAIGFFGLHVITAGSYEGEACTTLSQNSYKRLVTGDNRLKGYILLGDVARAGIYTALIRDQVPLDTIDFELIKEKPQLMAFSRRERGKLLGGARA